MSTVLLQGMAQVPHCLLGSSCWRRMTFGTSEDGQSPDRSLEPGYAQVAKRSSLQNH